MNEPATPPAPAAPSPATAAPPAKPSERTRIFTPIESDPARRPNGLRRLSILATGDGDALDSPIEGTRSAPPADNREPSRPPLRPLVPNAFVPFLLKLQRTCDPQAIDRRIAMGARALAVAALAAVLALAVGSSFLFQPDTDNRSDAAERRTAAPPASASPTLSRAESAAAVREALETLETFLHADSAVARQTAAGTADAVPAPRDSDSRDTRWPNATIDRGHARLHQAGNLKVVLVPVTHATGLPHTAAVVHRGDRWRVDWRSVVTPEPVEWDHFINGTAHGPTQFRVLLSHLPDGGWTLTRPESGQAALAVVPSPRVATDLAEAVAAHGGAPIAADVFLQTDPSRQLNIVDWTQDKWSL